MLVLSRKAGEAIVVGDDITLRILEVKGGLVRIGIEAPEEVSIHREEVFKKILDENLKAASEAPADLADVLDVFDGRGTKKQ
ncbi:MAG: carbon storage regulator CsrA [Proteobacteria bacterium]|nr:carbon storage regulator CsrA [Pseudomonadota bacterium]MBU1737189.1 carbon storage regulator CsrA [Pseudomonadota bacterium]